MKKFRDPIHSFIYINPMEQEIIDSPAFQRLRNIKQLAFTYMIYHGAEHTRFGHSIGVMHLVSKAFRASIDNACSDNDKELADKARAVFTPKKIEWYDQILRLIALTHDLGHAPFSHAAESVFDNGLTHEDYTEKIIKETNIAEIINRIGSLYVEKNGPEYNITPDLICDIYMGRDPGPNNEFTFLKTYMDSELDCDKMDYLLRDSLYCGVNYGKFDLDRLISCLTIYFTENTPKLAIKHGGVQSFEEFVLARYFMFGQVYFHKTRRFLDIKYGDALSCILPEGKFPVDVNDYLAWDDNRVLAAMKENLSKDENCRIIISRKIYKLLYETKTHPESADLKLFNLIKSNIVEAIGEESIIVDTSAGKMPHKIPIHNSIDDEQAIVIIDQANGNKTTISDESLIIKTLTEKINYLRIYVVPEKQAEAQGLIKKYIKAINNN